MTKPSLDGKISIGNIVSWLLVAGGFLAGYVKLQDASAQTAKDVVEAKNLAIAVQHAYLTADDIMKDRISSLTVDVAVIKTTVERIDRNQVNVIKVLNERLPETAKSD